MNNQHGFTLIEVMIVVAIIGILAAVATPVYQDYVGRSYVTAALSSISNGKSPFEYQVNVGASTVTLSDVGLDSSTDQCSSVTVQYTSTDGSGSINCLLAGTPKVRGKTISMQRSAAGAWTCVTGGGLDPVYIPKVCS